MKHNIRINGEIKEIDCELGSGYCDDNGNEIFEGDCVQVTFRGITGFDHAHLKNGAFYIGKLPIIDMLSYRLEKIAND